MEIVYPTDLSHLMRHVLQEVFAIRGIHEYIVKRSKSLGFDMTTGFSDLTTLLSPEEEFKKRFTTKNN